MGFASIDLDGMALMISRLEITADRLHHTVHNLRDRVARAGIDTGDLHRIGEIAAWIDDELPGLRRRLHLAIVADALRSEALRGTPVQIDEPTMSMAQATAAGNDLAARLTGADAIGDAEAISQLAQEVATYSSDPDVMGALYDRLGAAGTLDVMTRVAQLVWDDPEELTARTSLLEALKGGLSTAQVAWSDAQSRQFATTMVDLAARQVDASAYDHPGDFAAALSYLLYDSHDGEAFLGAVADRMDYHEQVTFNGWPEEWTRYGSPPNQWIQYFPADAPNASWDPGVSLMSALSNNPQAALDFFYQGSQPGSVTDRQMHWLHDRDWSDDQFAHLSEALLAATTDPSLTQPPDSATAGQAAHLASMTVNLIGHRDNISGSMISGDDARAVAAENFALILSTYLHGVNNMVRTGDCEWNSGDVANYTLEYYDADQHNTPMFSEESLRSFIALAASTEIGISTLRQGMDTYVSAKYALSLQYLAENPDSDTAQRKFEYGYSTQAKMEGLFVDAVGESAIAAARGEDETRAAWIALGGDLVSAIPYGSLVTKAGGGLLEAAVVNFTVAQAKKGTAGSLSDAFASSEGAMVDKENEAAEAAFQRANYAALRAVTQYPTLVPKGIPDRDWAPGGVLPSWEVFSQLPDGTQSEALSYLQSVDAGVGMTYDRTEFESSYIDAFDEYFEKGDG